MRKHLPALVVFLWLTALTLSGFVAVLNSYRERIQDEFEDAASAHAQSIQRSLEVKLLILESMLSLYAIFDGMPQPEFGSFVKPFEAKLEGVQALQWIVPVTADERAAFENARQAEGIPGFQITERNAEGSMVRAGERSVYFPVYPLLPLDTGEATVGYDMGSSPERNAALQQAITTRALTASARVNLVQEQNAGQYGFLVFAPLFDIDEFDIEEFDNDEFGREEPERLLGLVTGVFRISNIVDSVENLQSQEALTLALRDRSAPPPGGNRNSTPTRPSPGTAQLPASSLPSCSPPTPPPPLPSAAASGKSQPARNLHTWPTSCRW